MHHRTRHRRAGTTRSSVGRRRPRSEHRAIPAQRHSTALFVLFSALLLGLVIVVVALF